MFYLNFELENSTFDILIISETKTILTQKFCPGKIE